MESFETLDSRSKDYPPAPNVLGAVLKDNKKLICFCPNCRQIPKISFTNKPSIVLKCNCEKKITEYQIGEYIKILREAKIPMCENKKRHKDQQKESDCYCVNLKKWMCSDCREVFSEMEVMNDYLFVGLKISNECEDQYCPIKGKVLSRYFCQNCNIHICTKEGHESHKIFELEKFDEKALISQIKSSQKRIEDNEKKLKNFFEEMKTIEDYFIKSYEKYDQCKELLDSIYETYIQTKKYNNFNAIDNLTQFKDLNTDLKVIEKIQELFSKSLLDKIKIEKENIIEDNEINEEYSQKYHINEFVSEGMENLWVKYNILDIEKPRVLFKNETCQLKEDLCIIYVDGRKIPFSDKYLFENKGKHEILFQIKKKKKLSLISALNEKGLIALDGLFTGEN